MYYCYLETPIGDLLLGGDDDGLSVIGFPEGAMRRDPEPDWIFNEKPFSEARRQLGEYFAGKRKTFDLPLKPTGTEFQLQVLDELQKIPYGTTCSYRDIAERIGRPRAVRAVGAANGRNPIPIIIPCHRVIGASGDLTGFGGGLPTKEALLRLELENSQLLQNTWRGGARPGYVAGAEFGLGAPGGMEMLIVNGAVIYDGQPPKDESWLRFPDGDSAALIAMKDTTIWLKTGHLDPDSEFSVLHAPDNI